MTGTAAEHACHDRRRIGGSAAPSTTLRVMCRALTLLVALTLAPWIAVLASADPLDDLARDFWAWRAATQPSSGDDIPRLERPAGWRPDWSRGRDGGPPHGTGRLHAPPPGTRPIGTGRCRGRSTTV